MILFDATMVIRATDTELDISGSQQELDAVAHAIVDFARTYGRKGGDGGGAVIAYFPEACADPRPYDRCLAQLVVSLADASPAVRVAVVCDELVVTGSAAMLVTFASFFRFEPGDPPGTHHHHEWYEGNDSIARDSRPLVISLK